MEDDEAVAKQKELHKVDGKEEKSRDRGSGEVEEEDEQEVDVPIEAPEDAWFIPLGWARQCPPVHYSGTDPEWRSFVEFARDRQRVLSVQSAEFSKNFLI